MKVIGPIAAALLLGTGCAHDQSRPADTTNPKPRVQGTNSTGQHVSPRRASAPTPEQQPELACEVVGTGGSGQQSVSAAPKEHKEDCDEQATGGAGLQRSTSPSASDTSSEATTVGSAAQRPATPPAPTPSPATPDTSATAQQQAAPEPDTAPAPDTDEDATGIGGAGQQSEAPASPPASEDTGLAGGGGG